MFGEQNPELKPGGTTQRRVPVILRQPSNVSKTNNQARPTTAQKISSSQVKFPDPLPNMPVKHVPQTPTLGELNQTAGKQSTGPDFTGSLTQRDPAPSPVRPTAQPPSIISNRPLSSRVRMSTSTKSMVLLQPNLNSPAKFAQPAPGSPLIDVSLRPTISAGPTPEDSQLMVTAAPAQEPSFSVVKQPRTAALFFNNPIQVDQPFRPAEDSPVVTSTLGLSAVSSDESQDWDLGENRPLKHSAVTVIIESQVAVPSPTKEMGASASLKDLARSQPGFSQEQLRPLLLTRIGGCQHKLGDIGRLLAEVLREVPESFDHTNLRHIQNAILAKPQLCSLIASSCYLTLKMGCDAISDVDIEQSLVIFGNDWTPPDKMARQEMKKRFFDACLGLLEEVQTHNKGNLWVLPVLTKCWIQTNFPKLKQQLLPDIQKRIVLGAAIPQLSKDQIAGFLQNISNCEKSDQALMLRAFLCVAGTHPNLSEACSSFQPPCNMNTLLVKSIQANKIDTPEQILRCLVHVQMPALPDPDFSKLCEETLNLIRQLPANRKFQDNENAFEMELLRNPEYPSFLIDFLMQSIYESSTKDTEAMRANLMKFKAAPPNTPQATATVEKMVETIITSDVQNLFLDFLLKQSESLLMLSLKVFQLSEHQRTASSIKLSSRVIQVLVESFRRLLQGQFSTASKILDIAVRCQRGVCDQLQDLKNLAVVQESAPFTSDLPTPEKFREALAKQTKLTQELPTYRLRIQKLVVLFKDEFKKMHPTDRSWFEEILQKLEDQSLSTQDQLELVDKLATRKGLLQSAELMDFKPYRWHFRETLFKTYGRESSCNSKQFAEVAANSEKGVKSMLEELSQTISKANLDKPYLREDVQKGLKSIQPSTQLILWLEDPASSQLLTKCQLISSKALKALVEGLLIFEILGIAPDMKETFLKSKEYLTKKSALEEDSDFERFLGLMIAAFCEYKEKGEVFTQKLAKLYADQSAVCAEVFDSLKFHKSLGKIIPLIVHFFNKENYHFQDINSSPETEGRVSPNVVNAVQQLVQIARELSGTFRPAEFVKKVASQAKNLSASLEEIVQEKDQLLEASNSVHFTSAGEILKVGKIRNHSVVVFKADPDSAQYKVYCVLNKLAKNDHTKMMNLNTVNWNAKTDEIFTEDQLNDLEHRIALVRGRNSLPEQTNEQEPGGSQMTYDGEQDLYCDEFLDLMEAIKKIKKNLVSILRAGTIHALGPILSQKSKEKPNEKAVKRFPELDMVLSNQCIRETDLSISVQTQHIETNSSKMQQQKTRNRSNMAVFAEVLEAVEKDDRTQLFNSNLQYHNITYLKSPQRIMLCKNTVAHTPEAKRSIQDALRLVNHMLPGASVTEKTLSDAFSKMNTIKQDSGYATDVLTQLISTIQEVDQKIQVKKLVFPKMPDHKDPPKSIYYLEIKPADQYLRLNQLAVAKRFQALKSDQVFFGSAKTTKDELGEFLIRGLLDADKNPYFYLDLQLVPFEVLTCLIQDCIRYLDQPHRVLNTNIYLFVTDSRELQLGEKPQYFTKESFDVLSTSIVSDALKPRGITYQVYYSDYAGMGKTTAIRKALKGLHVETVFFSGDPMSNEGKERFELVEHAALSQKPFAIHLKIDMMDDMVSSCQQLDQILYSLVYLKSVTVQGLSVELPNLQFCVIEVQNSYKQLLLDQLRMLDQQFAKHQFIPRLDDRTLTSQLDLTTWEQDRGSQKWVEFLYLFWLQYKSKRYGEAPIDQALLNNKQWLAQNVTEGLLRDTLISMLKESVSLASQNRQSFEEFAGILTFQQLKNWASSLYFQLNEFESILGTNPAIHRGQQTQDFFQKLSHSRNEIAKTTLACTFNLVFEVPIALNQETNVAQQLAKSLSQTNNQISQRDQNYYASIVGKIPKFGDSSKVNYFFYKQTIGVIYRELSHVPQNVQKLVKEQTKQPLEDFGDSSMSDLGEKMIKELIKSLHLSSRPGLIDKLSADNRYKHIKDDHDKRALQYYKDQFREFNNKKGFTITKDNLPKILTIFQRMQLKMPIVIMGATGCGKTYMVDFIASCLMQDHFECFTLHTGVTEVDLEKVLSASIKLARAAKNKDKRVWLFFDEFNTSPLQCLISEIMIERRSTFCRSLSREEFPENLIFVAACNPFRIKTVASSTETPGLIAERSESVLSHRVFPVPRSLLYYTIDWE